MKRNLKVNKVYFYVTFAPNKYTEYALNKFTLALNNIYLGYSKPV